MLFNLLSKEVYKYQKSQAALNEERSSDDDPEERKCHKRTSQNNGIKYLKYYQLCQLSRCNDDKYKCLPLVNKVYHFGFNYFT